MKVFKTLSSEKAQRVTKWMHKFKCAAANNFSVSLMTLYENRMEPWHILSIFTYKGKGKCKVHPRTCHEGP